MAASSGLKENEGKHFPLRPEEAAMLACKSLSVK